jgi:hypothetical protein
MRLANNMMFAKHLSRPREGSLVVDKVVAPLLTQQETKYEEGAAGTDK